jgi:LCP family protein required for cell wall assembly
MSEKETSPAVKKKHAQLAHRRTSEGVEKVEGEKGAASAAPDLHQAANHTINHTTSTVAAAPEPLPRFFLLKLFLKTSFFTLLFLLLFFAITLVGFGFYAYSQAQIFSQNAGQSLSQIVDTLKMGWQAAPQQIDHHINFLVLGSDALANRGHEVELTDTILLVSLDLQSGKIAMYSIPRDLWLPDYKTRINALYAYGKDRYPNDPAQFPREVVQQMSGVQFQHTMIIHLETLGALIDEVGGIDVNVQEPFVDDQFPREDVDVTKVHDPKKLYKTIEFQQGVEHMSGERVLEFVRSRHAVGDQGTDGARAARQQQVVSALVTTLKNPNFFKDVARAGKLYRFYNEHFSQMLSLSEAMSIAHSLFPFRNTIHFETSTPSIFPDDDSGVIIHPPVAKYQGQWVYEVRNPQAFTEEVKRKLGLSD